MGKRTHRYDISVTWTGNTGAGTREYRAYERAHEILVRGKPPILASSDPIFRGDARRHSPEELLVASVSACHMLWYLHLCADGGVVVTSYSDDAIGVMEESRDGAARFSEITLQPSVTIAPGSDPMVARDLHTRAHKYCFIANSVNFPIRWEPRVTTELESS